MSTLLGNNTGKKGGKSNTFFSNLEHKHIFLGLLILLLALIALVILIVVTYLISPELAETIIKVILSIIILGFIFVILITAGIFLAKHYQKKKEFEKAQKAKGLVKYDGEWITVEKARKLEQEETEEVPEKVEPSKNYCSNCGHELRTSDKYCSKCAQSVILGESQVETTPKPKGKKNPTLAAVLSLFITGLGQLYNGQVGRGIGLFFLAVIGSLISSVVTVIVWIYAVYDAYNTAAKMNREVGLPSKPASFMHFVTAVGWSILAIMVVGVVLWQLGIFNDDGESTTTQTAYQKGIPKTTIPKSGKVTTTIKPTTTIPSLDFDDLDWCSSKTTDLQKKDIIERNKGNYLVGEGEVTSVSDSWGSLSLQVKHCSSTLSSDIIITMKKDQREELLSLSEGELVKYRAIIDRRSLFGGISADDGEIISQRQESRSQKCQRQRDDDIDDCDGDPYCTSDAYDRFSLCLKGY